jgi:hypothetical protein
VYPGIKMGEILFWQNRFVLFSVWNKSLLFAGISLPTLKD